MAAEFRDTLHALDKDRPMSVWIAFVMALILLTGWGWWLAKGVLPDVVAASDVRLDGGDLVASFPAVANPGNLRLTRIDQGSTLEIPGPVVLAASPGEQLQVRLPAWPQDRQPGAVLPEFALIGPDQSPAVLLIRALGIGK